MWIELDLSLLFAVPFQIYLVEGTLSDEFLTTLKHVEVRILTDHEYEVCKQANHELHQEDRGEKK